MVKKRIRPRHSIAGFTLLEVLVVIIIIGILFAIAAPGWDALISRQRVGAAREQVLQVIRQAQSDARNTRSARVVVFDPNPTGVPRVATLPYPYATTNGTALPIPAGTLSNINTWRTLGNGNIQSGVLAMTTSGTTNSAIVFDSSGTIAQAPTVTSAQFGTLSGTLTGFSVKLARANVGTNRGTDRCIIMSTVLGAARLEEGAFNTSTGKGCP